MKLCFGGKYSRVNGIDRVTLKGPVMDRNVLHRVKETIAIYPGTGQGKRRSHGARPDDSFLSSIKHRDL